MSDDVQIPLCACEQYYGTHHPDCPVVSHVAAKDAEIAALRAERDAARTDAERYRDGMRALERTLDSFDEITLSDYLGGVGADDITQRIVMSHGSETMHDVGSVEELLDALAASWREVDTFMAGVRAARAAEGGTPDAS